MADFCAVVSVLPCSPTNKGNKNICGCAEKANRQWAFVGFDCHRMSILKQRLRLQIDWRQKGHTFQFNLFLWVILHILHSTYLCHSASHATCHSANSFLLLPSPYQVTEKQFSTQFSWKDKVKKHLWIIQSFTCYIYKKKLNDCFFQSRRTAFWTEGPHIRQWTRGK